MIGRVALISEHASPLAILGGTDAGGQNVYVGQVARHLARRGYQVDVFTRQDHPNQQPVFLWKNGVRVIHVKAGPPRQLPKEDLLEHMGEFTDNMFRLTADGPEYDLLHANFYMSGQVAAEYKAYRGVPFVVTFHALARVRRLHQGEQDRFPEERAEIEDHLMNEADRVIAECPQDRRDMLKLYNANPQKISIVPCGFDDQEFRPMDRLLARQALGLPTNEPIIVHVGRMVPRKGVDNVIRAFGVLTRHHRLRAHLVIVGGDTRRADPQLTPEIGRLMRLAQSEGVANRVHFVGQRDRAELRPYYAAANVFVTTPWYEPFGITPLEAMACGTPVIGSRVGGIQYTVRDGETGYLVPPRAPEQLADRLHDVLSHPQFAEQLSRQATRWVSERFTWSHVTDGLIRAYCQAATTLRPVSDSIAQATFRSADHGLVSTESAEVIG